jgi:hypothetical protein
MEKAEIVEVIADRLNEWPGVESEIFLSQKKILSLEIKEGQVDHFRSSREVGLGHVDRKR